MAQAEPKGPIRLGYQPLSQAQDASQPVQSQNVPPIAHERLQNASESYTKSKFNPDEEVLMDEDAANYDFPDDDSVIGADSDDDSNDAETSEALKDEGSKNLLTEVQAQIRKRITMNPEQDQRDRVKAGFGQVLKKLWAEGDVEKFKRATDSFNMKMKESSEQAALLEGVAFKADDIIRDLKAISWVTDPKHQSTDQPREAIDMVIIHFIKYVIQLNKWDLDLRMTMHSDTFETIKKVVRGNQWTQLDPDIQNLWSVIEERWVEPTAFQIRAGDRAFQPIRTVIEQMSNKEARDPEVMQTALVQLNQIDAEIEEINRKEAVVLKERSLPTSLVKMVVQLARQSKLQKSSEIDCYAWVLLQGLEMVGYVELAKRLQLIKSNNIYKSRALPPTHDNLLKNYLAMAGLPEASHPDQAALASARSLPSIEQTPVHKSAVDNDVVMSDVSDSRSMPIVQRPQKINIQGTGVPGQKAEFTSSGIVVKAWPMGRGVHRALINIGTEGEPVYDLVCGSQLGRGYLESLIASDNKKYEMPKEDFKGRNASHVVQTTDMCQYGPDTFPPNREPATKFRVQWKKGAPGFVAEYTWINRSDYISVVGKKKAESDRVTLRNNRQCFIDYLAQCKQLGLHPDSRSPLTDDQRTKYPWLDSATSGVQAATPRHKIGTDHIKVGRQVPSF